MSNGTTKIDVTDARFDLGKVASDPGKLIVDGEIFTLDSGKKFVRQIQKGTKTETIVLEGDRLANALAKAFSAAGKSVESKSLDEHTFERLTRLADHFSTTNASVKGSQAAMDAMTFIKEAKPLAEAMKIAVKTPNDQTIKAVTKHLIDGADHKFVPADLLKDFTKILPKDAKTGKTGWTILQKTIGEAKSLGEAINATKFSEDYEVAAKELNNILGKYHLQERSVGAFEGLLPTAVDKHLSSHGLGNVDSAIRDFSAEVTAAESKLANYAQKMVAANQKVKKAGGWFAGKASLEEAQTELKNLTTEIEAYVAEHPARGIAFNQGSKSVQETLGSVSTIKSAVGKSVSGVGTASEGGPGIFKRTFTWTEDALSKAKEGAKGNADKLKKLSAIEKGSWRGSRVVMGAAAVTAAVVAGMSFFGNHDKDKSYVEAENQRRAGGQGQAAGIGA